MTRLKFTRIRLLALAAAMQAACGLLLMVDIASEFSELRGDPVHAMLEIAIAAALILGSLLIAGEFRRLRAENREMQSRFRVASGAFLGLLDESFATWNLSPAEREVALLAIKGFSTAEIATLRDARPGTIRAQCAAIYRKAGVSGRPQLLSHFIDDLLGGTEFGAGREESAAGARTRPEATIGDRAPLSAGREFP
jgi:DNA-binding CsgD family transcriptional regulator